MRTILRIYCPSLFYISVNWIFLGFGLLVKQNLHSEDVTLGSLGLVLTF